MQLWVMFLQVRFSGFKIVNVLGTCSMPFGILLTEFSSANIGRVQYEPELHPGATYQIKVRKPNSSWPPECTYTTLSC